METHSVLVLGSERGGDEAGGARLARHDEEGVAYGTRPLLPQPVDLKIIGKDQTPVGKTHDNVACARLAGAFQ